MKIDFSQKILTLQGNPIENGELEDGVPLHHTLGSLCANVLIQRPTENVAKAFLYYDIAKKIHDANGSPVELTMKEATEIQDRLKASGIPPIVLVPACRMLEPQEPPPETPEPEPFIAPD